MPPDRRWEATPHNRFEGTRKDYVGMVESMDDGVGRILKVLADRGLAGNMYSMESSNSRCSLIWKATPANVIRYLTFTPTLCASQVNLWRPGSRTSIVTFPGMDNEAIAK